MAKKDLKLVEPTEQPQPAAEKPALTPEEQLREDYAKAQEALASLTAQIRANKPVVLTIAIDPLTGQVHLSNSPLEPATAAQTLRMMREGLRQIEALGTAQIEAVLEQASKADKG